MSQHYGNAHIRLVEYVAEPKPSLWRCLYWKVYENERREVHSALTRINTQAHCSSGNDTNCMDLY